VNQNIDELKQSTTIPLPVQQRKIGRGILLTVLLASNIIFSGILVLPNEIYAQLWHPQYSSWWQTLLALLSTSLVIIITVGIWKWRRLAVYAQLVYLIVYFTNLVVPLFSFLPDHQLIGWTAASWAAAALGLWVLAIRRKWHLFM
jgi:hypothetical protein